MYQRAGMLSYLLLFIKGVNYMKQYFVAKKPVYLGNAEIRENDEYRQGMLLVDKYACFSYDKSKDYGFLNLQTSGLADAQHFSVPDSNYRSEMTKSFEPSKTIRVDKENNFNDRESFVQIDAKTFNSLCIEIDKILTAQLEGVDTKAMIDNYHKSCDKAITAFENVKLRNDVQLEI